MRLNGEWLPCADGIMRPVVRAEILGGDGIWRELELLVDTGADSTVISAQVFRASRLVPLESDRRIGGIGGVVESVVARTALRVIRDDGGQAVLRGQIAACTQVDALDMSVLGRDVLEMFTFILDRRSDLVATLGGRHHYTIYHDAS